MARPLPPLRGGPAHRALRAAVALVAVGTFLLLAACWLEASGAWRYIRVLPIAHESAVPHLRWYVAARLALAAGGLAVMAACLALASQWLVTHGRTRAGARSVGSLARRLAHTQGTRLAPPGRP